MPETRGQKRAAIERLNPLYYAGILDRVLSYAGPEQWLFISPVSKMWLRAYLRLSFAEAKHLLCSHPRGSVKCTSRKQVYQSASRVQAARAHGFQWAVVYNDIWTLADAAASCERVAGEFGSRSALTAARELGLPFTEATARGAAQGKCLPKLQWLITEAGCPYKGTELLSGACRVADLDSMQWLKAHGVAFTDEVLAAGLKHLHIVQFLLAEGCKFDPPEEACFDAACCGSLEVLKFCKAQGYAWSDSEVGLGAAMGGNMEILLWLADELHITWQPAELQDMLLFAGLEEALDMCKWLRAQGAEWPEVLGDEIRGYGWFGEVLEWAREQGCTSEEYYHSDLDDSDVSDDDADDFGDGDANDFAEE
jgi:hypothetical protein